MEPISTSSALQQARQIVWNLLLMAAGSALVALALNGILLPHRFASPGVTGVALLIHYMVPNLPVPALYLVLNIPLFALGVCRTFAPRQRIAVERAATARINICS